MNEEIKPENLRIHSRADELIACLEGEIAKRDARIMGLERYRFAFNEWHDKTEWVQAESATLSAKYLGCHRADVMRSLIDGLRAELAAIKAQEPVGSIEIQGTGFMCAPFPAPTWAGGRQPAVGTRLYAAPVSEAKAKGVVMPERWNVPRPMWKDARQPYGNPLNHADIEAAEKFNLALDEVSRLNAAPVQQVSVPDGCKACKACKGTGRRPIGGRGRIFGLTNRCFECQPLTAEEVYGTGDSHDQ